MKKTLLVSLAVLASCTVNAMAQDLVLKSIEGVEEYGGVSTTFLTYDSQDRLSKITYSEAPAQSYVFDYSAIADNKVVYVYEDKDYPNDNTSYTVTLGANGFAETIDEKDTEGGSTVYTFKYNADGRMTQVSIQEDGDEGPEVYDITYADGAMTAIVHTDKRVPTEVEVENMVVTSSDIDSKGCLGQFDNIFNIDIDNADVAAAAGLLGNSPAKLPAKITNAEANETYDYAWTVDANGYPATLKMTDTYEYGKEEYNFTFTWGTTTGINDIKAEAAGVEAVYGIDGVRRNALQPGLNIVRHADGTTAKVIVK